MTGFIPYPFTVDAVLALSAEAVIAGCVLGAVLIWVSLLMRGGE